MVLNVPDMNRVSSSCSHDSMNNQDSVNSKNTHFSETSAGGILDGVRELCKSLLPLDSVTKLLLSSWQHAFINIYNLLIWARACSLEAGFPCSPGRPIGGTEFCAMPLFSVRSAVLSGDDTEGPSIHPF